MIHKSLDVVAASPAPSQLTLDLVDDGLLARPVAPGVPAGAAAGVDTDAQVELGRRLMAEFDAGRPPLGHSVGAVAYDAKRVALKQSGEPPTAYWLDAIQGLFEGMDAWPEEVAPYLTAPREILTAASDELRGRKDVAKRGAVGMDVAPVVADPDGDADPDAVRALLNPSLHDLPGTMLCKRFKGEHPAISVRQLARLQLITPPYVREAAVLEQVVFRATNPNSDSTPQLLAQEGVAQLVRDTGADPADPVSLGNAIAAALRGEALLGFAEGAILRTVGRPQAATNAAALYAVDNPSVADAVMAVALAVPEMALEDRATLRRRRAVYALTCRTNRKKGAAELIDNMDAVLSSMIAEAHQAMVLAEECGIAEAAMRAAGDPGVHGFGWSERVVDERGQYAHHRQGILMAAYWEPDLGGHLDAVEAGQASLIAPGARMSEVAFDPAVDRIRFAFVGVAPIDGPTAVPTWARRAATGVLLSPGGLEAEVLEVRRRALVDDGLACPRYRPSGLLGPDGRDVRLFQRALNAGLPLVEPQAWAHGVLMGFVLALVIATSFGRVGEAQQILHAAAGWTVVGHGAFACDAFLAIPKAQHVRREFPIPPFVYDWLTVLVTFTLVREGIDELAVIAPARSLRHKCGEGVYLFSVRGQALEVADFNYLLSFLTGGFRTHDFRHAAANRAYREGTSLEDIAWRMKYLTDGEALAPYYAAETEEQLRRDLGIVTYAAEREDGLALAGLAVEARTLGCGR